jgi:hypothetical protein
MGSWAHQTAVQSVHTLDTQFDPGVAATPFTKLCMDFGTAVHSGHTLDTLLIQHSVAAPRSNKQPHTSSQMHHAHTVLNQLSACMVSCQSVPCDGTSANSLRVSAHPTATPVTAVNKLGPCCCNQLPRRPAVTHQHFKAPVLITAAAAGPLLCCCCCDCPSSGRLQRCST